MLTGKQIHAVMLYIALILKHVLESVIHSVEKKYVGGKNWVPKNRKNFPLMYDYFMNRKMRFKGNR